MKIERRLWLAKGGWQGEAVEMDTSAAMVVLYGGAAGIFADGSAFGALRRFFPGAALIGRVDDASPGHAVAATAIAPARGALRVTRDRLAGAASAAAVGAGLGRRLSGAGLRGVLLLGPGGADGAAIAHELIAAAGTAVELIQSAAERAGLNAAPAPGNVIAAGFYERPGDGAAEWPALRAALAEAFAAPRERLSA